MNWLIDRDFIASFMIVDEIGGNVPELKKDKWFDEIFPKELPYTLAAQKYKIETHIVIK